jgi:hypothetical protein
MDLTYSGVPDVKLRDWWTPEQKEQIQQSVASFYQLGEASLVNPMSFNDWNQLLYDCGYDLQNMQWPGGQAPMSQGNARRSVGLGVSVLPPSPGILPPVPGMAQPQRPQGVVGSGGPPILQPPSPMAGYVPSSGSLPQRPALVQFPATQSSSYPPVGGGHIAGASGAGVVPLETAPVFPGRAVSGVAVSVIPPGTEPVIPHSSGLVEVVAPSPPSLSDANTILGQQEITMAEMEQLLS